MDQELAAGKELATVLALVRRRGGGLVNVGHGRDPVSSAAATAFLSTWDGGVGEVVSWPAEAASWLRQACRFTGGAPDVWVVADAAQAWSGMARRLAATPGWRPARTVAFGGLACPDLPALVGFDATEGISGATTDGSEWTFFDGELRVSWS
ncbi:hypothetical protein Acsp05_01730 [Actinokineospora sp. NBRC 105648]|nr:hypothetical protein Acsp05_01730 [Actinokineospora sp. NBRC 105648]